MKPINYVIFLHPPERALLANALMDPLDTYFEDRLLTWIRTEDLPEPSPRAYWKELIFDLRTVRERDKHATYCDRTEAG